jgi:hypothetical protein
MEKHVVVVLPVIVMTAAILGMDIVFSKDQFWRRLIANIGVVRVFAACCLIFRKRL